MRAVPLVALLAALSLSCAATRIAPESHSEFTLADRFVVPEGLAFDGRDGRFFISSVYERKILHRSPDGTIRDFASGDEALGEMLGLEVDARRSLLWACSYRGSGGGTDALYAFDLRNGAVVRRIVPPEPAAKHLLNDVEVAADGAVFVTDTEAGVLYELAPEAERLVPMWSGLRAPNGLALDRDAGVVYVADDLGITAVDLSKRIGVRMETPPDVDVSGIDGLYYRKGALIGVQNASSRTPARVISIAIDGAGGRVLGVSVLEGRAEVLDVPTTGTIARNRFCYIANSGLNAIEAKSGKISEKRAKNAVVRCLVLPR